MFVGGDYGSRGFENGFGAGVEDEVDIRGLIGSFIES